MAATIEPSSNIPSPAVFTRFADRAPVGDVVPFFRRRRLPHLRSYPTVRRGLISPSASASTRWRHLRSTDLLHWEQLPEPSGPAGRANPTATVFGRAR